MEYFNKLITFILVFQFSVSALAETKKKSSLSIDHFALPSETKTLQQVPGAIYYSNSIKGKVLMPVNFWGDVNRPGLHFMPIDTKLISGLSMAGGPKQSADLSNIRLMRNENSEYKSYDFNISEGGGIKSHDFTLNAGDTIFIEKDFSRENRAFYLSLLSFVLTVASTALIYSKVKDN